VGNDYERVASNRRHATPGFGMTRYVYRHGRRIEVETIDTPGVPPNKVRRRQSDTFAAVPLQWAARASAAMNSPKTMLLVWLTYQAWRTKSPTFAVPNKVLADYDVSRGVKCLALRQLEVAGLIRVEWRPRKSPVVTLLNWGPG
jgi:hypothetical protein